MDVNTNNSPDCEMSSTVLEPIHLCMINDTVYLGLPITQISWYEALRLVFVQKDLFLYLCGLSLIFTYQIAFKIG